MERKIFSYFGGTFNEDGTPKKVFADPMAIARKIREHLREENPDKLLKILSKGIGEDGEPDPNYVFTEEDLDQKMSAMDKIISATQYAFGVYPLMSDGTGLTVEETVQLSQEFHDYQKKSNLSIETSPSLSPAVSLPLPTSGIVRKKPSTVSG